MNTNGISRRTFVKLSWALAASTLISGCGGSSDDGSTTETTEAAFKLGNIGPSTGAAAIYGTATDWGAQVAVNEINAAGGDVQFAYQWEDDGHVAETAVNAYNSLKDWGMQILVGTTTSAPCAAVSQESNADNIFELTPSASSTDVIGVGSARKGNVFQMCFTDPNQGRVAADTVAEKKLGTKVAIIFDQSDPYSTGLRDGFVEEAATLGLEIVSEQAFTSDNNTNFSAQLQDAKGSGAEIVLMPFYYQQGGLVLQQAKDMGFEATFVGMDGMDGILAQEGFDASLAEGLVLITPFTADSPEEAVQNFVTAYEQVSGGAVPNQFGADAYDCVYAIKQAIEVAGVTPDMSASDICDALVATFTSPDFVFSGLTGTDMTWSTEGTVSKVPACYVIQGGSYVAM